MMIEEAGEAEITAKLEQLAIHHVDLDASETVEHAASLEKEAIRVRTNRSGSMLWTTGTAFHYTAERYVSPRRRPPT